MKALKASMDFNRTVEQVALADIYQGDVPVTQAAMSWGTHNRHLHIFKSISTDGLNNPIILLRKDGKLNFVASGARIQYSVILGYTHIDAIVLDDESEVRPLMIEQAQTESNYIPEEYINRWWEEETPISNETTEALEATP